MITVVAACLLAIGWLTREPSEARRTAKRIAGWKRERYDLNPAFRRGRR